jgi:DNA-binding transcriptional ArsR family regulator
VKQFQRKENSQESAEAYILSHPVRAAIIRLLKREKEAYTGKMAGELGLSDRLVAFHLSILTGAGFVESEYRLTNPNNPPRVARYYRITSKVDETLKAFVEALK